MSTDLLNTCMRKEHEAVLTFLLKWNGASGTVLEREFGSLNLIRELVDQGLVTKNNWHWECGTELPDQYACYRVKHSNSKDPNS